MTQVEGPPPEPRKPKSKEPRIVGQTEWPSWVGERLEICRSNKCGKYVAGDKCGVQLDKKRPGLLIHKRGLLNPCVQCPLFLFSRECDHDHDADTKKAG